MATLSALSAAVRLLDWDRETLMPEAGAPARGRLAAELSALRHRTVLRDGVDDDIADIEANGEPSATDRGLIALARRERARAIDVPDDLIHAHAQATADAVSTWLATRDAGDFGRFAPALQRVFDLARELGAARGIGDEPYDALLDDFEPGARVGDVEALFAGLGPAVGRIIEGLDLPPIGASPFAGRSWPDAAQMALGRDVAGRMGFDFTRGFISRSAHPFTDLLHPGDIRFTTRLAADDPTANVLVVLHEVGHALYAQGLPDALADTLGYGTASLGADESQSRFFENHIGRRRAFWDVIHPRLVAEFGDEMRGLGPDDLHRAVTGVHRHWSRVDSDEVTYDLHIMMRFELELAMVRGELAVADLPGAWEQASVRLLDVHPPSNAQGCMQDIHWAWGLIGYFPTYTLGNVYAAQLAEAIDAEVGPLDELVADQSFDDILGFMREHLHRHGALLRTEPMMERATGRAFSTEPLLRRIATLAAAWR